MEIPFGGDVVTIGPTPRTANRLGLYVDSLNNTAYVLWDRADGGVMLTTLK
ncbi:MAG: hypothetical protein JNG84_11475 [Archangium sp.]|nr:hypothetical protein [Archangium sp.]